MLRCPSRVTRVVAHTEADDALYRIDVFLKHLVYIRGSYAKTVSCQRRAALYTVDS